MTLTDYLIEAVARRATGKYIEPNKDSIVKWLDAKGFKCYKWNGDGDEHIRENLKGMAYMVGPFDPNDKMFIDTNWISIHTPDLYEIVIWFDTNGDIDSIEKRVSDNQGDDIQFDRLRKLLYDSVK